MLSVSFVLVIEKLRCVTPLGYCLVLWQLLSLVHTDDPGLFWASSFKHKMGTVLRIEKKQRPHVTHPLLLYLITAY